MNKYFGGTPGGGGRLLEASLSGKGLEGPGRIVASARVGRGPFQGEGLWRPWDAPGRPRRESLSPPKRPKTLLFDNCTNKTGSWSHRSPL